MENETQVIKKRNLPKEVFLHFLAVITLYWSAISFITLLFQYINYFIPDALNQNSGVRNYLGSLRFAISSLVIVFPVFIFVSWILYKSYIQDSEKRESQIVNYWQKKEVLPLTLSDLNDAVSGYSVPIDPQTKASYEYNIKDKTNLSFELCATFNKSGKGNYYGLVNSVPMPADQYNPNWDHSAGRVCFERTIDKQLYPPLNKTAK